MRDLLRRDLLSQVLNGGHDRDPSRGLGGGTPLQLQSLGPYAQLFQLVPELLDPFLGPTIGVDVVAVDEVASGDENDGRSELERGSKELVEVHSREGGLAVMNITSEQGSR